MKDDDCVRFLQWVLPQLRMRWPGFRKVRRQVCKRIRQRMSQLQLDDISAYQAWIDTHPVELQVVDRFCRITISRFHRDRSVFDQFGREVLPALAREAKTADRDQVDCWSAGCASGEEPYTIGIIWRQFVSPQIPGVDLKVIATDCDPKMLQRSATGCYPTSSLKDLPQEWIATCFSRVDGEFRVRDEYRSEIEWCEQDIRKEMPTGPFDIIFCRHLVFTYFDETLQEETLCRIAARLRPGGIPCDWQTGDAAVD